MLNQSVYICAYSKGLESTLNLKTLSRKTKEIYKRHSKMIKKDGQRLASAYDSPRVKIIEMKSEGVLCASDSGDKNYWEYNNWEF